MAIKNGNGKHSNGDPNRIRKCAVYLRVSKALKSKGKAIGEYTSIDAQRDTCLDYIKRTPGYTYVDQYVDDGRSGKNLKRKSVQRLFADIDAGKIDTVIVYKMDRLSRSVRDFHNMIERFAHLGVNFVSVTQNLSTDKSDPFGALSLNMLMSFAEFERAMTAERTAEKIEATRRDGRWAGGPAPLGYVNNRGTLTIDESEAAIVREIFALYLETRSAFDVAGKLNDAKRPLRARGKETPRSAPAWTKDMVTRTLRNPVYIGKIAHYDEVFDGHHTPIMDCESFDAAGTVLAAQGIDGTRNGRNAAYTLQGVLKCGCTVRSGEPCGHAMSPGSGGKDKGRYRYYRCVGKEKGGDDCAARPLPAEAIEGFVIDRLKEIASAGQVTADLAAYASELVTTERAAVESRVAEHPAKIAKLSEQGAVLADRMMDAKPGERAILSTQLEKTGAELQALQGELSDMTARLTTIDAVASEAQWIREQLETIGESWPQLTNETRGHVIRSMVRSVTVNETANEIAIVFAPLDSGRRALGSDPDAGVSVVQGELYRVKGRAVAFTPDAPPAALAAVRRPAKVASMLALAHHMERAIRSGKYADQAALARALGLTRARITQVSNLTCIAPAIQAEILALEAVDGREPIRERGLRPLLGSLSWERQGEIWQALKAAAGIVNQGAATGDQKPGDRDSKRAPGRAAPIARKSPSGKRASKQATNADKKPAAESSKTDGRALPRKQASVLRPGAKRAAR